MLLTLASLATQAQDVYEYAILRKTPYTIVLRTERGSENISFDRADDKDALHLRKLAELTAQGWEVYFVTETSETNITALSYHLRKKKQ